MTLVEEILGRPEFADEPPVLVDIGASGALHAPWKPLARYAVCVAFDPDAREMGHAQGQAAAYRKLHVYPAIVTDGDRAEARVHLTRSPYCSSTLEPDAESLSRWAFADLFAVERYANLPAVTLAKVLAELGLTRVDWFKCDSQGTDLRLFRGLDPAISNRTLVAEMEPGFIHAYHGEDRLAEVLAEMDRRPFWLADFRVKGSQRIDQADRAAAGLAAASPMHALLPTSPGWAEMTYLNTFEGEETVQHGARRDWLLGWVVASIHGQDGFALSLARRGRERFGDDPFARLSDASARRIRGRRLAAIPRLAWRRGLRALGAR